MEEKIQNLEKEIEMLKARNIKVETDKDWETSYFRVILIFVVTYFMAVIFLYFIGNNNYYLNAIVPPIGYLISVQSLPFIKKWWIKSYE